MSTEPAAMVYNRHQPLDDWYRPPATGELADLRDLLAHGQLSGAAEVLDRYEAALAGYLGVEHVIALNSGSSALFAALHVFGAGPGADVLIPAAAPLPSALPILALGADPVLVDNLPGRLALDPEDVTRKLTTNTVAVMSVPLWGYPAEVDHIRPLLAHVGVPIVEDAAQAHGTLIGQRPAGTVGTVGCFSTHDRKLLATGEGGFVATDNPTIADAIECLTRLGRLDGSHVGVNFKLAAPLAAIGLRRLDSLEAQIHARHANAQQVLAMVHDSDPIHELTYGLGRPNYYNLVLYAAASVAADLGDLLTAWGLPPDTQRWRYRPLHTRRMFTRWTTPCPNAEALGARTLQLPVHPGLSRAQVTYVARCLRAGLDQVRETL